LIRAVLKELVELCCGWPLIVAADRKYQFNPRIAVANSRKGQTTIGPNIRKAQDMKPSTIPFDRLLAKVETECLSRGLASSSLVVRAHEMRQKKNDNGNGCYYPK
jgi:hypothetical protein